MSFGTKIFIFVIIAAVLFFAVGYTYVANKKYPVQSLSAPRTEILNPQIFVRQKPIEKPENVYVKKWGAYAGNTPESPADFQKITGKKEDLIAVFSSWSDPFPSDLAGPVKAEGQTLIIFWEPYGVTQDQIISGSWDSYILGFAAHAKAYAGNLILVPMEEMNGNWDPWDGTYGNNNPAKFVATWKHMHDLFTGIKNVKWGWDVNNNSVPDTPENEIINYWPGSDYADYVGVDGFNFGNPWQSYSDIFSGVLGQLKKYGKPIYIFSMACVEGPEKAAWITDALHQIKSDSAIYGWVWFNENKEENWLVNSDSAALQAFQSGIK